MKKMKLSFAVIVCGLLSLPVAAQVGKKGEVKSAPATSTPKKTTPTKKSAPARRVVRPNAPASNDAAANERAFWESIRNSNDPEDFRAYLKKYPDGQFVDLANNRLRALSPASPANQALTPPELTIMSNQADNKSKAALYKKFTDNRINNAAVAFEAAKEYLRVYSGDNDQYVDYLKKWVSKYEEITSKGSSTGIVEGVGTGPGRGSNTVGADPKVGVGGGGGGSGPVDYGRVFSPSEVTQKARIISRPRPHYTEEARKNSVAGEVVLRMVLTASGQVTNIRVVSGLPQGLSEQAIAAARQIRFEPAMKDGRPVSQHVQIVFTFSIY
jgi:TonB family protein